MNSTSVVPPRTALTFQMSSDPFSRWMRARMSRTSAAVLAGSRGARITWSMHACMRALNCASPHRTRARVSAMCSQVHASLAW